MLRTVFDLGYRRCEWAPRRIEWSVARGRRTSPLLVRGDLPPALGLRRTESGHRLVRDDRQRLGVQPSSVRGLARSSQLRCPRRATHYAPARHAQIRYGGLESEVHPNAARLDVGATEVYAAVRDERDEEPIRSFPTFSSAATLVLPSCHAFCGDSAPAGAVPISRAPSSPPAPPARRHAPSALRQDAPTPHLYHTVPDVFSTGTPDVRCPSHLSTYRNVNYDTIPDLGP